MIICDFDGTITKEDSCDYIGKEILKDKYNEFLDLYNNKEIDAKTLTQKIFEKMNVSKEEYISILKNIDIDPYFKNFVEFVRQKAFEFYILSDGFDLNIETILHNNNIDGLHIFANQIEFEGKNIKADFPNYNYTCENCGNCKAGLIDILNEENKKIIYIGDSTSDFCASKKGSIIFAKDRLAHKLDEEHTKYIKYQNFDDIIKYLKNNI
jgi:2,3-diketo-5-methylthio-1-phosphopentane phosphatase